MKTFIRVLIIIAGIIVLLAIIGFMLPRKMRIERSLFIKASPEVAYNQVNYLKNWEKWSPWHKIDTSMKLTYNNCPMGVGASYKWDSKNTNVGTGSLTITACAAYDSICMEMIFMENEKSLSKFFFDKVDGGTKVTWQMDGDLGNNPINRYLGLLMKTMVGKQFEQGLHSMKTICESMSPLKVEISKIKTTPYFGIADTCSVATISQKIGQMYGEIMEFMKKSNISFTQPPFVIYHSWQGNVFDMEACIPAITKTKPEGRIKTGELKAGKVVVVDYYGLYEGTEIAHQAANKFITANSLKIIGAPWEEYITDPATEKDPAKWLTKIYYPVE